MRAANVRPWAAVVAVAAVVSFVSFYRLGDTPIYFGGDEARFATVARSVSETGADASGSRFPLLFHMNDEAGGAAGRWYQPVLVYLMALTFRAAAVNEATARVPAAVIGVLDVLLVFAVGRRLVAHGRWGGLLAALFLAFSPAHLIFSRQALDYICPLPFIFAWLWCLSVFVESGGVLVSFAAGACLGVGFYSYIACWVMMPLYLALTWAVQLRSRRSTPGALAAAAAGFAIPVLLLVPWIWTHPGMLRDTIARYQVYDVRHLTPLQGVKDYLNYNNIQERVSLYWGYFNPASLFLSGGSNLTVSTRRAGIFAVALAPLLVAGLVDLWRRRSEAMSLALVAGFLLAPLPAALADTQFAIQRALFLVPFGVLIAAVGASAMLGDRRSSLRAIAVVLIASMPLQYASFCRDYFGDYRARSAFWFDPENMRDTAAYLIASDAAAKVPGIYFSVALDDVAPRWNFHLLKHGRTDLRQRTHYVDSATTNVDEIPAGGLLVLYGTDPAAASLVASGLCTLARVVTDPSGGTLAVVLRKNAGAARRGAAPG